MIARADNTLRVTRGVDSIVVRWKLQGIAPPVQERDVTSDQRQYMRDLCVGIRPGLFEQHLRHYFLADQSHVYALPLPSEVPLMNVLPLTLDDLDAVLTDGMPRDVLSN